VHEESENLPVAKNRALVADQAAGHANVANPAVDPAVDPANRPTHYIQPHHIQPHRTPHSTSHITRHTQHAIKTELFFLNKQHVIIKL